MRVAVDLSLYPLDADFIPPIKDVIDRLNAHDGIEVVTNPMATQVRGEYADVMRVLTQDIRTTFEQVPKADCAIQIQNNPTAD